MTRCPSSSTAPKDGRDALCTRTISGVPVLYRVSDIKAGQGLLFPPFKPLLLFPFSPPGFFLKAFSPSSLHGAGKSIFSSISDLVSILSSLPSDPKALVYARFLRLHPTIYHFDNRTSPFVKPCLQDLHFLFPSSKPFCCSAASRLGSGF